MAAGFWLGRCLPAIRYRTPSRPAVSSRKSMAGIRVGRLGVGLRLFFGAFFFRLVVLLAKIGTCVYGLITTKSTKLAKKSKNLRELRALLLRL